MSTQTIQTAKQFCFYYHKFRFVSLRHFYDWRTRSDSIFALATYIDPSRGSPLSVIRVSGAKTANVLQRLVRREPLRKASLINTADSKSVIKPRHATLCKILDPDCDELIDMGLVLWFPLPNSYTGEDTCEFQVHGSNAVTRRLISILGNFNGMRPAENGEFTRRAVENKKLSLVQAESLPDLISSKTDAQRRLALQGLTGSTRKTYEDWIDVLVKILSHLEASIDFGEDELIGEEKVFSNCKLQINDLADRISKFISLAGRCRELTHFGVRVAILGKPNAGKSTLMNIICGQEKSIVSSLSGTTRDIIEHSFELGGHSLILQDTAGLKDFNNDRLCQFSECAEPTVIKDQCDIEQEGVKRALECAKESDLIIYLVDGKEMEWEQPVFIYEELKQMLDIVGPSTKRRLVHFVVNKIDLGDEVTNNIDIDRLNSDLQQMLSLIDITSSMISCKTHKNIDTLIDRLSKSLDDLRTRTTEIDISDFAYVNDRHLSLLRSVARHLHQAQKMDMNTIDKMTQHVRESVDYLSRIVGTISNEQVFDIIFKDFCIGK